jgi:hypothetical protein
VRKQERFVLFLMLLLLFPLGALAQQKLIKGQVVDEMGEPIIGATVMVKGVTGGTITDIDGNFSIQGKVGSTLSVTYVGYAPLQVKVTKQEGNRLVMKEDAKVLDEVVVVGMDTQKRNTITAAVATLKDDAIVNRPVTDVTSALQGNIAGLNFASDAVGGGVGGEIGADIKFSIGKVSTGSCVADHFQPFAASNTQTYLPVTCLSIQGSTNLLQTNSPCMRVLTRFCSVIIFPVSKCFRVIPIIKRDGISS